MLQIRKSIARSLMGLLIQIGTFFDFSLNVTNTENKTNFRFIDNLTTKDYTFDYNEFDYNNIND